MTVINGYGEYFSLDKCKVFKGDFSSDNNVRVISKIKINRKAKVFGITLTMRILKRIIIKRLMNLIVYQMISMKNLI